MKLTIKKLLRENLLDERITINKSKNLGVIYIEDENIFLVLDVFSGIALGYISFAYYSDLDVFSVGGVYSKNGYGPLLYEIAMTYIYPKGLTLSQDGGTSGDAQNVWEKFVLRNDVKKEKIIRNQPSEKEEDLIGGCDGDEDCLEWVKRIIELHNIKFIYNLGKDKLSKLITKGNQYLIQHPDLDIMDMVYGLE
jgi:hypothetical protein